MNIYCAPRGGQNGSAAVYSLLKYTFGKNYGGDMPEIKKTPNGKPFFPGRPEIHFSLSHARTHVLCAVSGAPVGADIESPREINQRVIDFFCSPEELRLFDPLDLWVLKESYIKLIGSTVAMVRTIRFSRINDAIAAPEERAVSRLYRIDGCRAAVSCYSDPADFPESIELINGSYD